MLQNAHQQLDKKAFEELFKSYYPSLCSFAQKYVPDLDTAKEIVQNVFINLWQKRDEVDMQTSLKSFLFKSVYNRCLNHIRDHKKFVHYELPSEEQEVENYIASTNHLEEQELEEKINKALESLPEKCRQIFLMSRFEGLKYKEIADKLQISAKTVEVQMSKALRILREQLKDHLPLLLFLLWFKNFH